MKDNKFMDLALDEAKKAAEREEVPVGAVLVSPDGEVLAAEGNRILELKDPTAHAEILVIRKAAQILDNERLVGCELYVTLEPCAMCAGAISFARIARVHYGTTDPKGGAIEHGARFFEQPTCHHRPEVASGELWQECSEVLKTFFKARRK